MTKYAAWNAWGVYDKDVATILESESIPEAARKHAVNWVSNKARMVVELNSNYCVEELPIAVRQLDGNRLVGPLYTCVVKLSCRLDFEIREVS